MGTAAGARRPEHKWALVKIGERMPEKPLRVAGEGNQYVALWYHNGKPLFGRAWSTSGLVECSFPGSEAEGELRGLVPEPAATGPAKKKRRGLEGHIQILTEGPELEQAGLSYEWEPLGLVKRATAEGGGVELVHCAKAAPICLTTALGKRYLGNLDTAAEVASVGLDGGVETEARPEPLSNMLVLVRKPREGGRDWEALGYGALHRSMGGAAGGDLWRDFTQGQVFPPHTVEALDRPLNYDGTEPRPRHSVALFWPHPSQAVLGRAWAEDGRLQSSFGWNGQEVSPPSLQLLQHHLPASHGFAYSWARVDEFQETGTGWESKQGWRPVEVGGVAPCLCLTKDGFERLGQLDLRLRTASFGFDEKESTAQGPQINAFSLLAKKPL